jgi:deoxyribodipyrimidine photo-lyase
MQSGTTGQQVLRIYNPVKQAQELDPEGIFVRRWLPELGQVSNVWIFEPWRMPAEMKVRTGSARYPLPLVDFTLSHRDAKDEISMLRSGVVGKAGKGAGKKTSANAVHVVSGKKASPVHGADSGQISLFEEW